MWTRATTDAPVTVQVVRDGAVLAQAGASVRVEVGPPAAGTAVDHVDFGDVASEQAHAIQAHPRSGISSEAGQTRRYARTEAGNWFSAEVTVPRTGAFALVVRETFLFNTQKQYTVTIDGVSVGVQVVPGVGGQGSTVYRVLVDSPEALAVAADGKVRVWFQFDNAPASFDPSVADLWVVGVPDTTAPVAAVEVVGAAQSATGWYQAPVEVRLTAADSQDPAPHVQVQRAGTWVDQTGPIAVDTDGLTTVRFRALDAAGNASAVQERAIRLDRSAPTTTATVVRGTSTQRTVTLTAADSTSGVARTEVALDGGGFTVVAGPVAVPERGATVTFRSTDVAGNVEATRTLTVPSAVPVSDGATAAPGQGVLSSDNGHDNGLLDGAYTIRMDMWWGHNGSSFELYENGVLVNRVALIAATPRAQTVATSITGRANGTYQYTGVLINSKGQKTVTPITVVVRDASPAKPVLSADNWDGDGSYRITANTWYGTSATSWRLLEDGVQIGSGDLTAVTPRGQSVGLDVTGRTVGNHTYVVEFRNAQGTTSSSPLVVRVTR